MNPDLIAFYVFCFVVGVFGILKIEPWALNIPLLLASSML